MFDFLYSSLNKLFHCTVDCSCFAPPFVEFTCPEVETNLCAMKSHALQFPIGWSQCICIQDVKILVDALLWILQICDSN